MIVWQGESLIDGAPIVVLATGLHKGSQNAKTGAMVQTYIMRRDVRPNDALKTGEDGSVCGNCPHRPARNGTCYVNVAQGPRSTWQSYRNGTHQAFNLESFRGRKIRFGTYGDPAAVPTAVWRELASVADSWTGYTHQWRDADPALREYCMASADSEGDRTFAKLNGWRTFRVKTTQETRRGGEAICPASAEAGKKLNCDTCLACDGTASGRRGDVVITVHGLGWKVERFGAAANAA